jgi:hypothetical protein
MLNGKNIRLVREFLIVATWLMRLIKEILSMASYYFSRRYLSREHFRKMVQPLQA